MLHNPVIYEYARRVYEERLVVAERRLRLFRRPMPTSN